MEEGAALADVVATLAGEVTYYALTAPGRQGWLVLLQSHPLWPQLDRAPERLEADLDGLLGLGAEAETEPKKKPVPAQHKPTAQSTGT